MISIHTKNMVLLTLLAAAAQIVLAAPDPTTFPRGSDSSEMVGEPHTPRDGAGGVLQVGQIADTFAGLSTAGGRYELVKLIGTGGRANLQVVENGNTVCTIPPNQLSCSNHSHTGNIHSGGGSTRSVKSAISLGVEGLKILQTTTTCRCGYSMAGYSICTGTACNTSVVENKIPWQ